MGKEMLSYMSSSLLYLDVFERYFFCRDITDSLDKFVVASVYLKCTSTTPATDMLGNVASEAFENVSGYAFCNAIEEIQYRF